MAHSVAVALREAGALFVYVKVRTFSVWAVRKRPTVHDPKDEETLLESMNRCTRQGRASHSHEISATFLLTGLNRARLALSV